SCLAIVQAYKASGLGISEATRESPEYLGCEMGFMLELCLREQAAIETADPVAAAHAHTAQADFFVGHLGRWAGKYASAMVESARTGFYKGVGFLLADFIEEEHLRFSAE
ncbi:MAG: molecular chaperone TorD family protein, partial [Eggerthellaceae bacterium]|nr:molecular chaperone TorD family protein [Eggerthellaceae bacterium]